MKITKSQLKEIVNEVLNEGGMSDQHLKFVDKLVDADNVKEVKLLIQKDVYNFVQTKITDKLLKKIANSDDYEEIAELIN